MFFQGTLQHGIAAAVQQSKLVVSFVTDDADESKQWENEFLTDSSIASLLDDRAIALRMEAGSQEAGFLAAIYPLPKTPTLVIMMSNGQLKDYITSGVSKTDFLSRVSRALGGPKPQPPASVPAASPSPAASGGQAAADAPSESASSTRPSHDQQLAERAARIAAQRQKEAEEAAKRRKEKGKAKAEPEPEEADDAVGKPRDQVKSAAQQLRQRQAEARRERERILKQIEYDRTERKRKDEARRAARLEDAQAAEEAGEVAAEHTVQPASSLGSRSQKRHEFCALQVRLLDGSTIRTRLPSSDNIRSDVRKWVDESRGSDRTPYTLRVIFPNKLIDETDEDRSLEALGLTPSSTLVLVPVARFSSAYQNDGDGILGRLVAFIRHIIMMIVTFFTTIFTGAPREQQPELGATSLRQQSAGQQDGTRHGGQNDAQRDYQLYNGNSLNFEPRPEDNEADAQ